MAGYSRENSRQNEALQSILDGGSPEERVQVGYTGKKEKSGDKISPLSDIMKEARMPWFCPSCDKVMKKRLDDQSWMLYNHCFDCQVDFENKLRIEGSYNEWVSERVRKSKLDWIKDQKQEITELKNQKAPEFLEQFRPDGYSVDKEKWQMNPKEFEKQMDEALEHLQKLEDSLK